MKSRFLFYFLRLALPATIVFLGYVLGPLRAQSGQTTPEERPAPNHALARMMLPGTQDLQLIVELTTPSVVEYLRASEGQEILGAAGIPGQPARFDVRSAQASAYRPQIAAAQLQLSDQLSGLPGAQMQGSVETVMNAVIVRVPASLYSRVRGLPGVRKVYFSRPQRLLLDQAAVLQNAQGLWNASGGSSQAGKGIRIGIIDTGIDTTNPMFTDSSLVAPSGFPRGESNFTNSKVIVARNYVSLLAKSQRVQTAVDEVGHGSFVAGCAAGKQTAAPLATISGMAPGAFLGNYKVFGTPGVNDSTTTAAVLAAINDAVTDGMNVLNLSLGSLDYVPPSEDPEVVALENTIRSGVVVAMSAGNDGPATHTINTPGAAPDVIAVGSVTNSRIFAAQLHVTAPSPVPSNLSSIAYAPGDGPTVTTQTPSLKVVDVATLDSTGQACSSLPSGSLNGSVALILRRPCLFADKVNNAAAAGAVAVIIYNNEPTGGISPMSGLTGTSIPAVMISNGGGLALKQFVAANTGSVQVQIGSSQVLAATPETSRVVSSFSSAGPGTDFTIKPDLVAVGENVYSAAQSSNQNGGLFDASGFTLSQGTSFSSPMVAGTAAALKQLFPQLNDALSIKSLITNTASQNLTVDGTNPPNVLQVGNGLLDMGSAAAARAVFAPTNLSFGTGAYSTSFSLAKTLTIKNISTSADQYTLGVQPVVAGPSVTLSQSSTGPIAPNGTANVAITVQFTPPQSGGFQGYLTVQSASTGFVYRVPYWAGYYVPDSSRILSVSQNASGADSYTTLAHALNAARPGNIIEIRDSRTYAETLTITTNAEGLPLHGIIIRAAAGQTPTLDGSNNVASGISNILIAGVRNVLIQGLTISGGTTGVELYQPSPSIPSSVTIDQCTIANTTGGSSAAGIWVDGGGTVDVTKSVISNSTGTGIVAFNGTQLTVTGTTVQNNASDGIDTVGANVDILNSTITGNVGPGLNLDTSSGTIDGNTISRNSGSFGDGIEIADGTFTITNNTFDTNDRAGIGFFPSTTTSAGPAARIVGNTSHGNQIYGVYASSGQDLLFDSNLIKDNGRGFRFAGSTIATLTNNIVVRSTDSTSGDGIEVAGTSNVSMVNNTISGNVLRGIVLSSGALASVYNTIVSSNGAGDLQGLSSSNVQFSLIADGSVTGGGNLRGDPKFTNPVQDDFSLSAGSPALEVGTNSAPGLPFLDFNRRLRVAASPSGFGTLNVDMGATETNSSYPLTFPLLLNGSQATLNNSFTTGIAVLNTGSNPTAAAFTGYNPTGTLFSARTNPATQPLGPLAQIPILVFQLFGFDQFASVSGSVLATSAQPLTGFFLLFDATFDHFSTGVSVSDRTTRNLVFMRHESDAAGNATYVVSNPGVNAANVTATLYSPSGTAVGTAKTASVAPNAQFTFGFTGAASGSVRVASDRPVSGIEIFGGAQAITALGASTPGAEARLLFPHIAVNGGFSTQIGIVNTAGSPANVTLIAYDDSGNVLGTPVERSLIANSQLLQDVSTLFGLGPGSVQTGYVIAQSDKAGFVGFTAFTYNDGVHQSTATLAADSIPIRNLIFSHVAHQVPAAVGRTYQTGVALLNPFGAKVDFTMSVYNGSGALVAQKSDSLAPHQKLTKYLSHSVPGAGYFTQPLPLGSGHIEVKSDYGILGLELFFTEDFSQLAGVSAQSTTLIQ
ncbi:MAG TPA: S8 family serine peptidase [Acidobacteriota bacterium]|nr:S8 family serine peptidase [Acidobacteriota bacterium]